MKHLFAGIALLAVMLGFCLYTCTAVRQLSSTVSAQLIQACELADHGDYTQAVALVKQGADLWERNRLFCGSVLRHTEADGVSRSFAGLPALATAETQAEFCSGCMELRELLQHISAMEQPAWANIL